MPKLPISVAIFPPSAPAFLDTVVQAESAGIPDIWCPTLPGGLDPLPLLGAAAVQTRRIGLGSGIVPTYPRHPTSLAAEALSVAQLANGRFRLGIGSSHPFIVEGMHGLAFGRPVEHLREYVTVLRGLLWEGRISFSGRYYQVQAQLWPGVDPQPIPIAISALRAPMFRLAGEVADGALAAWCPIPYLVDTALPAMRAGARAANRPTPPLIANVPIAFHSDRQAVRAMGRASLGMYTTAASSYGKMFEAAGYHIPADGTPPDALIDDLFVSGDADTIAERLEAIHASGIDELMVTIHPVADPVAEVWALFRLLGQLATGSGSHMRQATGPL